MELWNARRLAEQLMEKHGLSGEGGYRFVWDNAKRRFGCCFIHRKLISLSKPLTLLNEETDVRDTILHEIAHALTPTHGHNAVWKAKCREIGCTPERLFGCHVKRPELNSQSHLYRGCPRCGWWKKMRRIGVSRYICATCRNRLEWWNSESEERFITKRGINGKIIRIPIVGLTQPSRKFV
jgi:predicted SprT family Zn-dependent metalloprotease